MFTDNKSLLDVIKLAKYVTVKRYQFDTVALKESLLPNEPHSVKWIISKKRLADVFTKQVANSYLLIKAINDGCIPLPKIRSRAWGQSTPLMIVPLNA